MSLRDRNFRTDGKTLEPCCKDMNLAILGGRIIKSEIKDRYSILDDDNTALINGKNCPFCGKLLKFPEIEAWYDSDANKINFEEVN